MAVSPFMIPGKKVNAPVTPGDKLEELNEGALGGNINILYLL